MAERAAALRPHEQFVDLAQQGETATLGMWVFLATEVLFFGVTVAAYLVYRETYPEGFAQAARQSVLWIGGLNTAILVTSSLTMVTAIDAAARDREAAVAWLLATAALGALFLGLKGYEYIEDYRDAVIPALNFHPKAPAGPALLFWLFYFYATLLHALHLSIGIALVLWAGWRTRRGDFASGYLAPLEIVGLYWSFVDTIWVILFALIYPVGRSLG